MGMFRDFFSAKKKTANAAAAGTDDGRPVEDEEYRRTADRLNSQRDMVKNRMKAAMDFCYETPSQESMEVVFHEFAYAVIYRIELHVPLEVNNGQFAFHLLNTQDFGWVYAACTTPEELAKSPSDASTIMLTRDLFRRVLESDLAGLVINPYHESKTGVQIFLRKENIAAIMKYAGETIDAQPENVRRVLNKK